MALLTKIEATDRIEGLVEDAMRSLGRGDYPDARDFLEAARAQTAAITAMPIEARKVPAVAVRDPKFSTSLSTGLAILGLFPTPADGHMLGIIDIAEALGMSRSTVHRYTSTLVLLGQLEQTVGRKYRRPEISS